MNFSEDKSDEDDGYEDESFDGENPAEGKPLIQQEDKRKEDREKELERSTERDGNGDDQTQPTKMRCCQRCCDASFSVIATVILMSCVFVVAVYFAYRYDNFAADVDKHSNDTQSIEELERCILSRPLLAPTLFYCFGK